MTLKSKNSTTSNSFIVLTQVLGSCILAISFVFQKLGWVMSLIVQLHSFISICIAMYFFSECCFYTKSRSYKDLTVKLLGKPLGIILDVSLLVSYYGFMTGYIIISSNSIRNFVLNHFGLEWNHYYVKIIIAVGIMFPLTMLKSLKQLSVISTFAGLIIFVFIGTVVVYFFIFVKSGTLCTYVKDGVTHSITYSMPAVPTQSIGTQILYFFMYIPSMHGNFSSHPVVPRFLTEISGPYALKKRLIRIAVYIGLTVGNIGFLLVGFMGGAMFGSDIKQNIFNAFAPCNWMYTDIIGLGYCFVVIVNYPLVLYPLKTSLVQTFGSQIETKKGYRISIWVNLVYLVLTLLLALFLETIVSIFGLFAAIAGFFYYFFVPFYCYIVLQTLRQKQKHLDEITVEEQMKVDNAATAILAMVIPTEAARKVSIKMFGQQELKIEDDGDRPRRVSIVRSGSKGQLELKDEQGRTRTASIGKFAPKPLNQKVLESATVKPSNLLVEVQTAVQESDNTGNTDEKQKDVENQEQLYEFTLDRKQLFKESPKKRKIIGILTISVYCAICIEGVIMNLIDIINSFTQA